MYPRLSITMRNFLSSLNSRENLVLELSNDTQYMKEFSRRTNIRKWSKELSYNIMFDMNISRIFNKMSYIKIISPRILCTSKDNSSGATTFSLNWSEYRLNGKLRYIPYRRKLGTISVDSNDASQFVLFAHDKWYRFADR